MPLYAISETIDHLIPSNYLLYCAVGIAVSLAIRTWSAGRRNDRERDLHGRTFIVTGAFTPMGVRIVQSLGERGAQIVALHPDLLSNYPQLLIPLLQQSTSNPLIYAEKCDLRSPRSIRGFAESFTKGKSGTGTFSDAPRLDGIVLLHEYEHVGMLGARRRTREGERGRREELSRATFALTNAFLPFLLRAPPERDVRIVNVVNPWYATAVGAFDPVTASLPTSPGKSAGGKDSIWQLEGERSLRSILFARHCQRVLDALAQPPVPPTDDGSTEPVVAPKIGSNIKCMTVCPGIGRAESVAPFFGAGAPEDGTGNGGKRSFVGRILYYLLFPLLFLLTKSPSSAVQTALYALYLPHPVKLPPNTKEKTINGGELYRECEVVRLPTGRGDWLMNEEKVGRAVWEWYERGVKEWGESEPKVDEETVTPAADKVAVAEDDGSDGLGEALKGLKGKLKES